MEGNSGINPEVLDLTNITKAEITPREKEVREVSEKAKSVALEKLGLASNLTDYLRWHRAASVYLTPDNIDWMWDYGGVTPEGLISEQESEPFTELNARNSKAAEQMRVALAPLEPRDGMVRIALTRVRNEAGIYDYRVLAAFPKGRVEDPLDGYVKNQHQKTGEDVIFYEPETACVNHACDDLFKEHRGNGFYIPLKTMVEAMQQLQIVNPGGAVEYMLEKTEAGKVTQETENYITVGLHGGYSNERFRTRISDFWNKTTPASPTIK